MKFRGFSSDSDSHTLAVLVKSASLLSSRDRRRYLLLIAVQSLVSLLDVAGLALIGLVVLMASALLSGTPIESTTWRPLTDLISETSSPLMVLLYLSIAAASFLIGKTLLSFTLTRRIFRFLANRQAWIAGELAAYVLAQPLLFLQRHSSQFTASALTRSVSMITMGILGQFVVLLSEAVLLIVLLGALMFVDVGVTIIVLVVFGLVGLLTQRAMSRVAREMGSQSFETDTSSFETVQNAIGSYREITVLGRRSAYVNKFATLRSRAARVHSTLYMVNLMPKYIYEVAFVVGGAILAATQFATKNTPAAIAVITIFIAAASRISPSLLRIQAASIMLRTAIGESAPAFSIIRDLDMTRVNRSSTTMISSAVTNSFGSGYPSFSPTVVLHECSLTYPGVNRPALDHVTLRIEPGARLAIVGATGAGKSTLADMILGILEPDNGTVTVAGLPPLEAIARFPGAVAYVPQEVSAINGSVRENVALGLPRELIDDDLVWNALQRAHLENVLVDGRDGLDTAVGEHGVKLSGGQRQRLGLARALYTGPRLIVLDEATSALDADTEDAITTSLREVGAETTQVVIAHRLATVRDCDQVCYLDQGRIRATGTFDEVRTLVPEFDRQASILGLR